MPHLGVSRRLAAIVSADVAGYSRLIGRDEEGTLARLRAHREELIDATIAAHEGRIVKVMGDGLLIEFPSVVEAARCAVEVQQGMTRRNAGVPEDDRIEFRIGINLGDIVIEDDDIFGEGVIVATRLEALAEPGGICVSRTVRDSIRDRMDIALEDMGEAEVKNVARPIHVFRIALTPKAKGRATGDTRPKASSRLRPMIAVAAIAAVVVGSSLAWLRPWQGDTGAGYVPEDKPSIAVLPFSNLSDDKEQEYFSDGMADDIITDLSKLSGVLVIARNSTFTYKDGDRDVKQIAQELGVRYLLEGSVRRSGHKVRINAQLVDATTGGHLWADRYDGTLDDIFTLQDEITRKIVSVLSVQLKSGEEDQFALRQTDSPEAYDEFLKGWDQYLRQTPESFREAITHFEKAVELDSDYSRAYAALAATYWQVYLRYWQEQFGFARWHDVRFKAEELLRNAQSRPTALSHKVAAAMLSQQGRHTEAVANAGMAIANDPNDADSYVALASALTLAGEPGEALKLLRQAMRLNPHHPASYLYELGLAQFGSDDFRAAAASLEQATALNSEDRWSFRLLLATYGHLGRVEDAARIFELIKRNRQGFDPVSVRAVVFWYPFKDTADRERLTKGLRLANVPE